MHTIKALSYVRQPTNPLSSWLASFVVTAQAEAAGTLLEDLAGLVPLCTLPSSNRSSSSRDFRSNSVPPSMKITAENKVQNTPILHITRFSLFVKTTASDKRHNS